MNYLENTKKKLTLCLPNIVFILCVIQPILDVISYWTDRFNISNTPTLVLRFILLFSIIVIAFLLTEKKFIYLITAGLLLLLTTGHIFACLEHGYNNIITDLTNLIRIFHFPILALCFITFLKTDSKVYTAIIKGFIFALIIIAAVELISVITQTNPYTYWNKQIGILGWFYFANTQSAIVSVLVAIFIYCIMKKFSNSFVVLFILTFASMSILFMFATRLTYISLVIIGLGFVITYLITDRTKAKPVIALLLVTVIFIAAFPFSPMYKNQTLVAENAIKKQEQIDTLIDEYEEIALSNGLSGDELKVARLEGAYTEHLGGLVERFGLKKTVEKYNYSEKVSDICDDRKMKINFNSMLAQEYGIWTILFGIEMNDLVADGQNHDIENDFHGIYYLCGAFGLLLLLLFLGYFVFLIIKALITDFNNKFNIRSAAWGISLISLLLHVYATAGVLRRPNGSFYLSVVLAVIYFITKEVKNNNSDVLKKGH